MYMKQIFLKFCLYIFCMFYDFKMHPLLRYVSHKDDESYQETHKARCRSVGHWEEVSSWVSWQPWQCSWKEQLARERESAKSMLFWKFHYGDVRLFLCLPSWFPREHFEALDFKIMFLANSVHLGFWNISWTYSPRPRNYSYGKLLLYVEQEPFVLSDAIDTSNVTPAIPCEAPGLHCSSVSSQHGPSHSVWTFGRLFHSVS